MSDFLPGDRVETSEGPGEIVATGLRPVRLSNGFRWFHVSDLRLIPSGAPCCGSVHEFHLLGCAESKGDDR